MNTENAGQRLRSNWLDGQPGTWLVYGGFAAFVLEQRIGQGWTLGLLFGLGWLLNLTADRWLDSRVGRWLVR
jgi:hypothetical protein